MEYRGFWRHLGIPCITIGIFAKSIKFNPNSIINYLKRETMPSDIVVIIILMGEMTNNQLYFERPLEKINVILNKTLGGAINGGLSILS